MEAFGTAAAAISLVAKIKGTFDQAGYNKDDSSALYTDIQALLSRINSYLTQTSTPPSKELCQDLYDFEKELNRIINRPEISTKQRANGTWGRSVMTLKELYNAGDIKHSLDRLRQEIQICEQNLQRSCAIRMDCEVSSMLQNQECMQRQLQMLVDALLPTSNPMRMSTLERIEDSIQDRISIIDTDGALGQELARIRTMNGSQAALSIKTAKLSVRSYSSSVLEKGYLKKRVKELANTLPRLSEHAARQNSLLWFRDPFKGLIVWEDRNVQNRDQQASIRETLRILEVLRSNQKILYVDAARDLFGLGRALGDLGMREEASVMYDWGGQICREIAGADNPRMLFNLAQFLHKLFLDLRSRGQDDIAERVLTQVMEVRPQLGRLDQVTSFAELASSLCNLGVSVYNAGRYEDAVKIEQEAITMRRKLVEKNRDTYLPDLALSLSNLGFSVHMAGRYEVAVKIEQEAVTMHRELVERNRDTYLPDLARSMHNIGYSVYLAGRYEDAVKLQQETVTMRQELVKRNRDTNLLDLAHSLHRLGIFVHSTGRYEDAVKLLQETVTMYRELVERDRKTHLPELALSIRSLVMSLSSAYVDEEAAVLEEEACGIDGELAKYG